MVSIPFNDCLPTTFVLALFTWRPRSMVLFFLSRKLWYNQELNKCLLNHITGRNEKMVFSLTISGYLNINLNEFLIGRLGGSVKKMLGSMGLFLKQRDCSDKLISFLSHCLLHLPPYITLLGAAVFLFLQSLVWCLKRTLFCLHPSV